MLFILLKVETVYIKLLGGFILARALNGLSHLNRLLLPSLVGLISYQFFSVFICNRNPDIMYIRYFRFKCFVVNLIGRHIGFFTVNLLAVIGNGNFTVFKLTRNIKAEVKSVFSLFNINRRVNSSVLYLAYLTNGIPVLLKLSRFIRRYPCEIRLIIGIHAGHQLNIRTVFIGKV